MLDSPAPRAAPLYSHKTGNPVMSGDVAPLAGPPPADMPREADNPIPYPGMRTLEQPATFSQRTWFKLSRNPLIPLGECARCASGPHARSRSLAAADLGGISLPRAGMAAVVASFVRGVAASRQGDRLKAARMMRWRVLSQFGTVFVVVYAAFYQADVLPDPAVLYPLPTIDKRVYLDGRAKEFNSQSLARATAALAAERRHAE